MALFQAVFKGVSLLWLCSLLLCAALLASGIEGAQLALALKGWVAPGLEVQAAQWADSLRFHYTHPDDAGGGLNSALGLLDSVFRLSSLLLSAFWRELLIVLAFMYIPVIKAQLYDWSPDWLWELARWSWEDDSANIPDLEPCVDDADDAHNQTGGQTTGSRPHSGSIGSTAELAQQYPPDWLVYDPVMGVLPREVVEVWRKQEGAREHEVQKAIRREQAHKLPPVRFSDSDVL